MYHRQRGIAKVGKGRKGHVEPKEPQFRILCTMETMGWGDCNSTKGSQSTQSMRHKNKINTGSQSIRKPDEKHETGSREAGGKKKEKKHKGNLEGQDLVMSGWRAI